MSASFRAFMAGLIDYAGLFPPAALEVEPAIRLYAEYRNGADAWMLGRFIIPAARLEELDPFVELFDDGPPLTIAALGRSGADEAVFNSNLEKDLGDIARFHDRHGRKVNVDVFEAKLSPQFGSLFFADSSKTIDGFGQPPLTPYYEAPLGSGAAAAIAAIAHDRASSRHARCHPAGFKMRCGGVEASAFPDPQLVAEAIAMAVEHRVPVKCTAGLHHPIRRFDKSVNTKMYGFLNMFGAGMLAATHNLSPDAIRPILEDEDPKSFSFDADGFHWRDLRVNAVEVAEMRQSAMVSYGSCSFDEPREDLRGLGLL